MSFDQETVYFQEEATYTFEAYDVDGDILTPIEVYSLDGDELTLTLKVRDDDFSNSLELMDTVMIINSPPTVSYTGETSQNALTDLNPEVETEDDNDDPIEISWQWYRNNFLTTFDTNLVSSENIAAGDTWLAIVTPNDGIENGTPLEIHFTISNIEPTAQITAEENLIRGKMVSFSALDSTDDDGSIINAIWSVDGAPVHQGLTYSTIMSASLNIEVKVFDDMGAFDITDASYSSIEPPLATNVQTTVEGTEVSISWTGNAELWAVAHNGEIIATTSENMYVFSPTLSGNHSFTIYPMIDNQQITIESPTSTSSVELNSGSVPETPGPSESLGMIFSIILILIGIGGVSYSFIRGRD